MEKIETPESTDQLENVPGYSGGCQMDNTLGDYQFPQTAHSSSRHKLSSYHRQHFPRQHYQNPRVYAPTNLPQNYPHISISNQVHTHHIQWNDHQLTDRSTNRDKNRYPTEQPIGRGRNHKERYHQTLSKIRRNHYSQGNL